MHSGIALINKMKTSEADSSRFSIIIPHHNIPDLLMRCLKSIPVSEDIQVIVVDDNSLDADTYIERYPELSRPYLTFIRTSKGGGAGYARNVGLEYAKGTWLLFVDADDYFVDNMLETIMPHYESAVDVIFYRVKSVKSENILQESWKGDYLNRLIDSYKETGEERFIRLRWCPPWGKMIRKELITKNQLRFDEVPYGNDYYFSVCVGCKAHRIEVVDSLLYVYVDRKGSLSSDFGKKTNELASRAEVSFRVHKLFKENGIQIEQHRPFRWYLAEMLKNDRKMFKYYYERLAEIYPSKMAGIKDISKDGSLKFKTFMYLYG